jgi:uncharacterized protein YaaQ
MKLLTAIINKNDAGQVGKALTKAGFAYTKMASVGGFLTAGNTTFLIGVDDGKVDDVLDVIKNNSASRKEYAPSPVFAEHGMMTITPPLEVQVGGAIVFVQPVERFEKM